MKHEVLLFFRPHCCSVPPPKKSPNSYTGPDSLTRWNLVVEARLQPIKPTSHFGEITPLRGGVGRGEINWEEARWEM